MTENDGSIDEINKIVLMFHSIVVMIHSFIFICIKFAYNEMKLQCSKQDKMSLKKESDVDYMEKLARSRLNLNDGYELPKSVVGESNIYESSDFSTNAYERRYVERQADRTVYAEIYNEPRLAPGYDADKTNDYNTLQSIR